MQGAAGVLGQFVRIDGARLLCMTICWHRTVTTMSRPRIRACQGPQDAHCTLTAGRCVETLPSTCLLLQRTCVLTLQARLIGSNLLRLDLRPPLSTSSSLSYNPLTMFIPPQARLAGGTCGGWTCGHLFRSL